MLGAALPIVSPPTEQSNCAPAWFDTDPRDWHSFSLAGRDYLLVVDQSRIYEVNRNVVGEVLSSAQQSGDPSADILLATLGIQDTGTIDREPPKKPPLRSLSLAVAQVCNLGCSYCYAEQGDFGGSGKIMPLNVALQAIDLLFGEASPGDRVQLSFLGGEPLLARDILQATTRRAIEIGRAQDVTVGFSITTNGTLLTAADAAFFEEHSFAVTVSLDGVGAVHDRLRPFKNGRGSFSTILNKLRLLLDLQRNMQVSARVTVTPKNLELRTTLDQLIGLGFHSVGFSPMLASPTGSEEMGSASLAVMLEQMIECGAEFERRVITGERYPFSNMAMAMQALHRGTHRPYPCGAGAGYFGVSADGELHACHRFVGDGAAQFGTVANGLDRRRQERWLTERHVLAQQPCSSCWARFLCGGGCHHEVLRRGRPACEFVRGWLQYCLQAYVRLLTQQPDFFVQKVLDDDEIG